MPWGCSWGRVDIAPSLPLPDPSQCPSCAPSGFRCRAAAVLCDEVLRSPPGDWHSDSRVGAGPADSSVRFRLLFGGLDLCISYLVVAMMKYRDQTKAVKGRELIWASSFRGMGVHHGKPEAWRAAAGAKRVHLEMQRRNSGTPSGAFKLSRIPKIPVTVFRPSQAALPCNLSETVLPTLCGPSLEMPEPTGGIPH